MDTQDRAFGLLEESVRYAQSGAEAAARSHGTAGVWLVSNEARALATLHHRTERNPILSPLTVTVRDVNEQRRISGSHYIFAHPAFPEILNLQQVHGQAKPYQVRQLPRLMERYNLALKGDQ